MGCGGVETQLKNKATLMRGDKGEKEDRQGGVIRTDKC